MSIDSPVVPENFARALVASIGIAVLGIVAWAVLAETVHVRSALVSFGVAIGTAAAFRRWAPRHPGAPVAIVGLTIASAVLGLLASQYALLADAVDISFLDAVNDVPLSKVPHFLTIGTDAFTWIIVAVSVYSGYRAAIQLRGHQRTMTAAAPIYGAPTPPPAPDADAPAGPATDSSTQA
jgi:hypothetical protein